MLKTMVMLLSLPIITQPEFVAQIKHLVPTALEKQVAEIDARQLLATVETLQITAQMSEAAQNKDPQMMAVIENLDSLKKQIQ